MYRESRSAPPAAEAQESNGLTHHPRCGTRSGTSRTTSVGRDPGRFVIAEGAAGHRRCLFPRAAGGGDPVGEGAASDEHHQQRQGHPDAPAPRQRLLPVGHGATLEQLPRAEGAALSAQSCQQLPLVGLLRLHRHPSGGRELQDAAPAGAIPGRCAGRLPAGAVCGLVLLMLPEDHRLTASVAVALHERTVATPTSCWSTFGQPSARSAPRPSPAARRGRRRSRRLDQSTPVPSSLPRTPRQDERHLPLRGVSRLASGQGRTSRTSSARSKPV